MREAVYGYASSLYMTTTTMTTIGYGHPDEIGTISEQLYLCVMIFFGIATFAYIQNSALAFKEVPSLEEGLTEQKKMILNYLAKIDGVRPGLKLSNDLY